MEDILQSIKRIIEDDSVADAKPAVDSAPGDILELTQAIREDGTVASLPLLPSVKAAPEPSVPQPEPVLMEEPKIAESPVEPTFPESPLPELPLAEIGAAKPAMEERLVSAQAAQAAVAALKPVMQGAHKDYSIPHIPSSSLRNGHTVEDLVLEALRPMLKSWLDEHLPLIVHKIVEKEVKRIVTFHQD